MAAKNIVDKIWEAHTVVHGEGGVDLLYIDLHLVHEVTSPQAFEGLRLAGRRVRRPDHTFATIDHNVPTDDPHTFTDEIARRQVEALRENARTFGITLFDLDDPRRGIVHVIGPELGLTWPGMTVVCGDSHTSTHGAFGALAFGIGTSEVEHVLATQTLWQKRPKTMEVRLVGKRRPGVTAKDIILAFIARFGPDVGQGYAIEYTGEVVRAMGMEERMTLCNMSIEAGARAGLVSPDATTVEYLRGRPYVPSGAAFEELARIWLSFASDPGATYDRVLEFDVSDVRPFVTWGTHPGLGVPLGAAVPEPSQDPVRRPQELRALEYMALEPGAPLSEVGVDVVFIGSCTNGRLEDLRLAAQVVRGRKVHPGVQALVVPGSMGVKLRAEAEGLDRIFREAGFEWRYPGCSMCLGMNPDIVPPKKRAVSTSNRNFEGRQGRDARTHLASPPVAALAAILGRIPTEEELLEALGLAEREGA